MLPNVLVALVFFVQTCIGNPRLEHHTHLLEEEKRRISHSPTSTCRIFPRKFHGSLTSAIVYSLLEGLSGCLLGCDKRLKVPRVSKHLLYQHRVLKSPPERLISLYCNFTCSSLLGRRKMKAMGNLYLQHVCCVPGTVWGLLGMFLILFFTYSTGEEENDTQRC